MWQRNVSPVQASFSSYWGSGAGMPSQYPPSFQNALAVDTIANKMSSVVSVFILSVSNEKKKKKTNNFLEKKVLINGNYLVFLFWCLLIGCVVFFVVDATCEVLNGEAPIDQS